MFCTVWGVDDYLRCESPDTAEFIRERAKSLAWLRASWGAYYYLGWQGGQYFAVRKDDGSVCRRPRPPRWTASLQLTWSPGRACSAEDRPAAGRLAQTPSARGL